MDRGTGKLWCGWDDGCGKMEAVCQQFGGTRGIYHYQKSIRNGIKRITMAHPRYPQKVPYLAGYCEFLPENGWTWSHQQTKPRFTHKTHQKDCHPGTISKPRELPMGCRVNGWTWTPCCRASAETPHSWGSRNSIRCPPAVQRPSAAARPDGHGSSVKSSWASIGSPLGPLAKWGFTRTTRDMILFFGARSPGRVRAFLHDDLLAGTCFVTTHGFHSCIACFRPFDKLSWSLCSPRILWRSVVNGWISQFFQYLVGVLHLCHEG